MNKDNIMIILCDACCYLITRNGAPFMVINGKEQSENFIISMKFKDHKNDYQSSKMALFNFANDAFEAMSGTTNGE